MDNGKQQFESEDSVAGRIESAKVQLERMVDLNPQVMLLVDNAGTIVRANRALLDLTEIGAFTDVLGKHLGDIFRLGEDDLFAEMLAWPNGRQSWEAHVSLPNGFVRELNFTLIGPGNGDGVNVLLVHDITGQKEREADRELRYKYEAVSALVGGLKHTINQPLTVIMVTVRLMQVAVEKPDLDRQALAAQLASISDLAMRIKALLDEAENAREYRTEAYLNGSEIIKLGS